MRKYIGEIGLIITAIIWGSGFVASAVSLEYYTPYQILAGRFLIGVLILAIVFHKRLKTIKKSTLIKGSILGIVPLYRFCSSNGRFTIYDTFKKCILNCGQCGYCSFYRVPHL